MKKYYSLLLVMLLVACTGKETYLYYSEYGAVGDGVTDDFDAIIKTHAAANEAGMPVRADAGKTYYVAQTGKTAEIQTDTDWGDARFIIDDSRIAVDNGKSQIFTVSSKLPPNEITSVKTLRKNQEKINLSLLYASFIVVTDNTTLRYIREGINQNNGFAQTDVFVVDKDGHVDMKAPIIWDYDHITTMTAYPIDDKTLTVHGGHFTTIANQAESMRTYFARGIGITRSNVVIDGLYHAITGEPDDDGAPYSGFISVSNCTQVLVQNCRLSGHMTYISKHPGNAGATQGTYDISVNRSTNVTFRDCKQINDIHDPKLWGIFASNYSKNLMFDAVEFSRFDAHMGVANATIMNSVLGRMSINIIGCGVFLVENTKVCGSGFINLRSDYGSTFEGEIIIRNCDFIPRNGAQSDAVLINGSYSGQHDFGYPCYMPEKITIDGLVIHDNNPPDNYQGPKIFAPFNRAFTSEAYVEKYPYTITKEVEINNLTVKSGKPLIVSNNPFMFRNVRITGNNTQIATYCRFVPERMDDFAWENDRVAFRVYGPECQKLAEQGNPAGLISSGVDCWLKRVEYPVIDKWYLKSSTGGSYHKDDGEGLDNFHVGKSRGCGGTAILSNGEYIVSQNFSEWQIIENSASQSVFRLKYKPVTVKGKPVSETKTITIKKGDNYYRCDVEFESELNIDTFAIGLTLHDNRGVTNSSPDGWITYWEPIDDSEIGMTVFTRKNDMLSSLKIENKGEALDHMWLFVKPKNNKATYYTGFGWKKSGHFTSSEAWDQYVKESTKKL